MSAIRIAELEMQLDHETKRAEAAESESRTLAGQVAQMREALRMVAELWTGLEFAGGPGADACEAINRSLAIDHTATERLVVAATAVADEAADEGGEPSRTSVLSYCDARDDYRAARDAMKGGK